jgi:hypothetical protein
MARADQVVTRGGGVLDGEIVERRPDAIVIDVGGGTIGLPLAYVERIVPGPSPAAQFRARSERLAPVDVAGWLALGEWARRQDLRSQAGEAFLHVLARDPDNAAARHALGHVRVGGEWMTREEGYRARGLVLHDGAWITPDERAVQLAESEAALARERAEAESLARLRESEARAVEAEAQARLVQAQARIVEEQPDRIEHAPIGFDWSPLSFGGLVPARFVSTGLPRAFPACRRPALGGRGVVHVPGRGGALMVSRDPLVVTLR